MLEGEKDLHLGYKKNSVAGNNRGEFSQWNVSYEDITEHGQSRHICTS